MEKKGVALLLALLSLVIISLLIVAFLELTTIELQIVSNHFTRNQALYIADAGVEYGISELRNNRNWKGSNKAITFPPSSGNTYTVNYSDTSGIITSVSRLSSGQQVTLQAAVTVTGSKPYTVKIISWREP